jgi:hypothetical protein
VRRTITGARTCPRAPVVPDEAALAIQLAFLKRLAHTDVRSPYDQVQRAFILR